MRKATFDPGLTTQYGGPLRRAINPDGTFNVVRRGTSWRDVHPYLHLVSISWPQYLLTVLAAYIVVNALFAVVYYALGPDAIQANFEFHTPLDRFLAGFYFSSHTLTTVGFGSLSPKGAAANLVAALEALVGLLAFAVATGVFFGRVSRPSARIGFSERALIAPYQDGLSLQFRVVNRRANSLLELEVTIVMMTVGEAEGGSKRKYEAMKLEREKVYFFPLTWTVVHPIDPDSPLYGKTAQDLEQSQAEFLILVRAFDETFGQTVHQRYSYRYDEVVWNARFTPAFGTNEAGDMVLSVDRVGAHARLAEN
jgi:inward rectifier potassium channel